MHLDFTKATDGKNRQLTKLPKHYDRIVSFLSSGNDGIGTVIAENVVNELNIKSLKDLFKLNIDRLCLVEKVGEKTAEKILIKIHGENYG